MQKVELYYKALEAKWDMEKHIKEGWRVHTCTLSSYPTGYTHSSEILVIYEKG